jgi:hypothetical protein
MVDSKFLTNVHLASWPTALGVPAAVGHDVRELPTVGSTGRWGQAPAAVATGGRIPGAVAHGGRIPSVVA